MKSSKRGWIRVVPVGACCLALSACSSDDESKGTSVELPHFHDVMSAPAAIQTAAKAVVRLHTAGSYGTGAYISSTGLLLTNNHVLGQPVCPREGCFVEVSTMYQRGTQQTDDQTYLAVPVAVDSGLDMAIVQLMVPVTNEQPATPNYLEIDAKEADALIDQHVTVVGHPEANLKKWTDGVVVSTAGKWFTASTYILPGDSGSPVLSDQGKIVGLIHRGPGSLNLVTEQGVNVYGIGTASAPIQAALGAALPASMLSVAAATTEEEFIKNDRIYLNARATTVSVGGASLAPLDILGRACDAALLDKSFLSLDELGDTLEPCYAAPTWIECRQDVSAAAYGVICPDETDRVAWRGRYQRVNQLQMDLNGIADYFMVGAAIARLETSMAAGKTAGAQSLQRVLEATSQELNFELAYYLAMFGVNVYDGKTVSSYITKYSEQAYYELDADYIAYSATWLASNQTMTATATVKLLEQLLRDPKVSVGAKLSIESILYEIGAL